MRDFVQEVWDAKEGGLPHPGITELLQTRDGYLWVGTFGGVSRFDGHRFEAQYVAHPALSDNVRALFEAPDGSVWVGTRRSGAVRLLHNKVVETIGRDEGLPSLDVHGFNETRDGKLWVIAGGQVLVRENGRFRAYGVEHGVPRGACSSLFIDRDATLWLGTSNVGIAWYDGARFHTLASPTGLGSARVTSLLRDENGALIATTADRAYRITGERTAAPRYEILEAREGAAPGGVPRRGALWVGGEHGVLAIDGEERAHYTVADGLLHNIVPAVIEDTEGNIWIGTRIGLARLRPRLVHAYTRKDGLPADLVTAVIETRDGDLWVGTDGGLAWLHDGRWSSFGLADGLPSAHIRALAEGPDGSIWIGTNNGLVRRVGGRFKPYRIVQNSQAIRAVSVDDRGQIWVGTFSHGVHHVEDDRLCQAIVKSDLCWMVPHHIVQKADGSMWLAGSTAVAHMKDGSIRCHTDRDYAPRNDVRYVLPDGDSLWVGSIGGLARFEKGEYRSLAWKGGPFRTTVYSILNDGLGSLWMGTPKGLFQVSRKDLESTESRIVYRAFGIEDGMASSVAAGDGSPSAWKARDGRLYFATASGLVVVDPRRIEKSAVPPPVHIERLIADQQDVDLDGDRRLKPGTREVQIDFVALSFAAPELVEYKYKLEGFDRDWVASGARRTAYYMNLPPSSYRFRVMAANHDGVWNETGAALDFELVPRLHQRAWFAPLVVALIAAAGVSFYKLRVAALRARQVELQQHVDAAIANVRMLEGLLPICASCRRVREDTGYWRQIETYVMERSRATFSHSICPECYEKMRAEDPNLPTLEQLR